jgi:three-Cys-motif partner protein
MEQLSKLKEVSKAKHYILEKYFPSWASILGSKYHQLYYVDCFAGEGKYKGGESGSPLLIFHKAHAISSNKPYSIHLKFVEKNKQRSERLKQNLGSEKGNKKISFEVFPEDSLDFTTKLLKTIPINSPVFFFIDPYGHPISIPVINQILQRPHTEILLNLMWFQINRDLNNPRAYKRLNRMLGSLDWLRQPFTQKKGRKREEEFLDYFCSLIQCNYHFRFRIRFDPDDRIRGREKRTKYYLIHFCNYPKAILLMKQVMWGLGDEEGTFDYSASSQGVLFSRTPTVEQLIKYLRKNYVGTGNKIEFTQLQIKDYHLPFVEKHYRKAIQQMELEGQGVSVNRIKSKRSGITKGDIIHFA